MPLGKDPNGLPPAGTRAPSGSSNSMAPMPVGAASADSVSIGPIRADGLQPQLQRTNSIYDVRRARTRWSLLGLAAMVQMLLPFANTMYMPALAAIRADLNTTTTLTAASISVYMFAIGTGCLLWGPVSDRWGRRWCLYVSSVLFLGFTVGCIFSHTIVTLIVFRALQGLAVAAFGVSAQAVVSDVFAPSERGRAMGLATIPVLVGPVVGPLLGGVLAQTLGWRSTFIAMAILGVVVLAFVFIFMEETHHYHYLQRVRSKHGDSAVAAIRESSTTPQPHLQPPWQPIMQLMDLALLPYVLGTLTLFGTLYACMTIMPYTLAAPPYSLKQAVIGVCNMALGIGLLVSAPVGGALADRASRRWPSSPAGRMLAGAPVALAVFPAAATLFGWALHYRLPLGVLLASSFFIGLAVGGYMPASAALISILKQRNAAAASGGLYSLMFLSGGAFVIVSPMGEAHLGIGPFVTLMAGIACLALGGAVVTSIVRVRRGEPPAAAAGARAANATPSHRWSWRDRGSGRAAAAAAAAIAAAKAGDETQCLLAVEELLGRQERTLGQHTAALASLQGSVAAIAEAVAGRGQQLREMLGEHEARLERRLSELGGAAAAAAAVSVAAAAAAPLGRSLSGIAGRAPSDAAAVAAAAAEAGPGPLAPPPRVALAPDDAEGAAASPTAAVASPGRGSAGTDGAGMTPPARASSSEMALLERHLERMERRVQEAFGEQRELLTGGGRRVERIQSALDARGVALHDVNLRMERLEGAVTEQLVVLRGRERQMDQRLSEHGAALRELLVLLRGPGGRRSGGSGSGSGGTAGDAAHSSPPGHDHQEGWQGLPREHRDFDL